MSPLTQSELIFIVCQVPMFAVQKTLKRMGGGGGALVISTK